jgi:hypothetical protein
VISALAEARRTCHAKETTLKNITSLRRAFVGAMTLAAVAITALAAAPGAHATTPKPLKYQDSDGPGILYITPFAQDPATGGDKISVLLQQNGRSYSGEGFQLRIHEDPPNQSDRAFIDLIVFNIRDSFGRVFQFRGRIQTGGIAGRLIGSGRYEQAGTGIDLDQWTLSE